MLAGSGYAEGASTAKRVPIRWALFQVGPRQTSLAIQVSSGGCEVDPQVGAREDRTSVTVTASVLDVTPPHGTACSEVREWVTLTASLNQALGGRGVSGAGRVSGVVGTYRNAGDNYVFRIPRLTGLSRADAESVAAAWGLDLDVVIGGTKTTFAQVTSQDPAPGQIPQRGALPWSSRPTRLRVVISHGAVGG